MLGCFRVQHVSKDDYFSYIFLDKIFCGFLIDFGAVLARFWEPKSMNKSIEIGMKIVIVSDIDFGTFFDICLSCKFR